MPDLIRKTIFMLWFTVVTTAMVVEALLHGSPITQFSQGVNQMDVNALLAMLLSLTGFGAFVSFLVNALKSFGIVTDDTSTNWVTGLNLVGLVLLFVAQIFRPDLIKPADSLLAAAAQIGMIVIGLLFPNGVSRLTHVLFRGVPLIGTSFSVKHMRLLARAAVAPQAKPGEAPGTAKR